MAQMHSCIKMCLRWRPVPLSAVACSLHCFQQPACKKQLHFYARMCLTGLRHLDIRHCRRLGPNALHSLHSSSPTLQTLLCDSCSSLGPGDLAAVSHLTRLTELSLSACTALASCSLGDLAQLPHLGTLSLCSLRELDEAGVAGLEGAGRLQVLKLDCCPLIRCVELRPLVWLSLIIHSETDRAAALPSVTNDD